MRSSIAGAEKADTSKAEATKSTASASTGIFGAVHQQKNNNKTKAPHFKTPTRLPSQHPSGSAIVSEASVDPKDKVATWLRKAATDGDTPTQERPINSNSLITQTTLVSASQAGVKKTPNVPLRSTPGRAAGERPKQSTLPDEEESQADSILVAKKPQRKPSTSVLNRTIESEIVLENGPELFQSQSDEYQKKKDEKRMKKIEGKLDSSIEKKGVKGIGLRRRKLTPMVTEREPESSNSDSESDQITHRKKKSVCIISDDDIDEEPTVDNPPVHVGLDTTVADFVENGEKIKSSKQYFNKRHAVDQQNNAAVKQIIVRDGNNSGSSPVKSLASGKRSRLSLRASPKPPTIVEVISPVSSPSTRVKERQEEPRASVNAKAFSRFKEMKSNFKEKKKIVPLNVSTTSAPHVISTGKVKKLLISSREMIIESSSDKRTPASSATKESCVKETVEDEPGNAEAPDENDGESQTECSPIIVENSLPVECSPKFPQRILQQQQQHLNTPTSTSPSVISNSPQLSPHVTFAPAMIISPSTVKLLEKGGANSNVSSGSSKRKTFSLESNTGEIAVAGLAAQQSDQASRHRRPNPKCKCSCNMLKNKLTRSNFSATLCE